MSWDQHLADLNAALVDTQGFGEALTLIMPTGEELTLVGTFDVVPINLAGTRQWEDQARAAVRASDLPADPTTGTPQLPQQNDPVTRSLDGSRWRIDYLTLSAGLVDMILRPDPQL